MMPTNDIAYAKIRMLGPSILSLKSYRTAQDMGMVDTITIDDSCKIINCLSRDNTKIPDCKTRKLSSDVLLNKQYIPEIGHRITSTKLDIDFIYNGEFWVDESIKKI